MDRRETGNRILVNINDFLNVRYSTRNLSDTDFEDMIIQLSQQLEKVNYHSNHTEENLREDWGKLIRWTTTEVNINSTSRIGMKMCEHFFPNFYDIEDNKGKSFANSWTPENLQKVLRWNRLGHSTPYLSELKRGIYFCCGLTKNTMYRPQMAKLLCLNYKPEIVLDPCAGWGGRMLGVVSSGARYIAFEPNTKTYNNLQKLINFLDIADRVQIICDDALKMNEYNLPKVDMVLTSPPYFDLEIYTKEDTQSVNNINDYSSWVELFLEPLIKKSIGHLKKEGISCWNVGKVGGKNMSHNVNEIHNSMGYEIDKVFSVVSSKRQALQTKTKNEKSLDITEVFKIASVK